MSSTNKVFRILKNFFIILLMLLIPFSGYVVIITRNAKNMTLRQRVLKTVYPAFAWWSKATRKNTKVFTNENLSPPAQSVYDLSVMLNNGETIFLSEFKGKKLMLVNTASDCGYTEQYAGLQKLYEENKDKLVILGFPANDFKQQEKRSDEEIAEFCKLNYGITFPLAKKSTVITGKEQNLVFQWLTDKTKNGWTNKKPSWNFSKYLVNEEGILINYFDPSISPTGKEVMEAIKK
jgi:glutathione peroxidase